MNENETARALLYGLRGVPAKCDFCDEVTEHQFLEPEEGGLWVCHKCLERWDSEESNGDLT